MKWGNQAGRRSLPERAGFGHTVFVRMRRRRWKADLDFSLPERESSGRSLPGKKLLESEPWRNGRE